MDLPSLRDASVALVDIAAFSSGDPEARREVAAQLAAALERLGCVRIAGHGVSPSLLERMDQAWRRFFARPLAYKRTWMAAHTQVFRGYFPFFALDTSNVEESRPPDLRELYLINRLEPLPQAYLERLGPAADYVGHPNLWPDDDAELRAVSEAYYAEMQRLAEHLMQIFAVALDLPPDYFADKIACHHSTLSASYYPELHEPPPPGQVRCGVHCDYGSLTILHQDDAGGLQVQRPDGEWMDVPAVAGTLLINLGDTMQEWTCGRWRSPPHRVVNPPPERASTSRRQSLLFFHAPNYDTVLAPLPGCAREGDPPAGPPRTVGELIFEKGSRAVTTTS